MDDSQRRQTIQPTFEGFQRLGYTHIPFKKSGFSAGGSSAGGPKLSEMAKISCLPWHRVVVRRETPKPSAALSESFRFSVQRRSCLSLLVEIGRNFRIGATS